MIKLSKHGFERWREGDFSDDGSYFQCYKYRVGDHVIRVSKTLWNGQAYISARDDASNLPYGVLVRMPHYQSLNKLNGVPINYVTDDAIEGLAEDIQAYVKEVYDYKQAQA